MIDIPLAMQCDRSAVGAWWLAVPRVARRLAALAPRATHGYFIDRSAVAECRTAVAE